MSKVLRLSYAFITKDYRILKLLFVLFGCYFIVEAFFTYFVLRPTYTSNEKRKWTVNDFPEIILCPQPSADMDALKSRGYPGTDYYFKGIDKNSKFIGWAGNQSENVLEVSANVSIFKSTNDCPSGDIWYKDGISMKMSPAKYTLTKVLPPYHVCCKVIQTEVFQFYPIIGVQFIKYRRYDYYGFEVFLADEITASIFTFHKTGDRIDAPHNGFNNFKVTLMVDEKLEEDPKYPCLDYSTRGSYAKCLENEIIQQNLHLQNCTPPWMTSNHSIWCTEMYDMDSNATTKYLDFLQEISISEHDPGKCLIPCSTKRYQAKDIGHRYGDSDEKGLIIWFENEVGVTKSEFTMDFKTMMSKIGGFIGISKNFLWLTILFTSCFGVILSQIKNLF